MEGREYMDSEKAEQLGKVLAALLDLEPDSNGLFATQWGRKSHEGLARVITNATAKELNL